MGKSNPHSCCYAILRAHQEELATTDKTIAVEHIHNGRRNHLPTLVDLMVARAAAVRRDVDFSHALT
jgi:hypothetical protein